MAPPPLDATGPGAPAPRGRDGQPVAEDLVPDGAELRLSRRELLEESGLTNDALRELESFNLVARSPGTSHFDASALQVARLPRSWRQYGFGPRHLRPFRLAVDRELALVEQVVLPIARGRQQDSMASGRGDRAHHRGPEPAAARDPAQGRACPAHSAAEPRAGTPAARPGRPSTSVGPGRSPDPGLLWAHGGVRGCRGRRRAGRDGLQLAHRAGARPRGPACCRSGSARGGRRHRDGPAGGHPAAPADPRPVRRGADRAGRPPDQVVRITRLEDGVFFGELRLGAAGGHRGGRPALRCDRAGAASRGPGPGRRRRAGRGGRRRWSHRARAEEEAEAVERFREFLDSVEPQDFE